MKIEISEDEIAELCAAIDQCLKPEGSGGVWHLSKLRCCLPSIRQKLADVTIAISAERGRKTLGGS